jgi:prepilin-type N-terminal cleavage/methylation domain-containing protein
MNYKQQQQGFTLLELLVVITLLAVLSVGALVAYEGIGENASNVAAANNIKTADSSIRAYRAIENVYPNQWDNLANLTGAATSGTVNGTVGLLSDATRNFFGQWEVENAGTDAVWAAAANALNRVGINELQTLRETSTVNLALVSPNEALNESAPGVSVPADELSWEESVTAPDYSGASQTTFNISTVPSNTTTTCETAGGANLAQNLSAAPETLSTKLNRINDNLDDDGCHLVVALGFGKDVPGTTLGSRVAISTAPTYTNGNIVNPATNYARYVALFHLGSADEDGATPTVIQAADILATPRLLAVVDTEGRNIDQSIAGAFASN